MDVTTHPPGEGRGAAVRIDLLGGFTLTVGGTVVPEAQWRRRKARALVKILALAPQHRRMREEVLEALWPDLDPLAADNNLRGVVHAARRILAPHGTIANRDGTLVLEASTGLSIDVAAFAEAATLAGRTGDPVDCARALDLYGGELLPEDRYEDWASAARDHLREQYLGILRSLAAFHERSGAWSAASNAWSWRNRPTRRRTSP